MKICKTDFKRTFYYKAKNGVEIRVDVPEEIYQEKCRLFLSSPEAFETAKKEIILNALNLKKFEPVIEKITGPAYIHNNKTIAISQNGEIKKYKLFLSSND